jgi:PST family polysaccharide transporter
MTKRAFEPAHKDVRRHVTAGILSTGAIQSIKILCQFGSVIILAHLLSPSDFGLVAMVGPVIGFVVLFQDLGLSQATVQKTAISHDEINAFFWLNVAMGLALSVILMALSPLVGLYYGDQRVVALTVAMGALVFPSSLANQHSAILQRRMQFGITALIDAVTTLGALATSIVWAIVFGGYWSLYAGMVVGTMTPVIGLWLASGWRPSAPRKISGLRDMLAFGGGLTINNFMGYIGRNMDNVLIGHAWGDQELGFYDRAYKLLVFPLQRFVWPLGGVMVPVLSRLLNEPDRYRSAFLKTLGQLTLAIWPGILWALVFSDTLIPVLLGDNWVHAAAIFKPLAVAGLLQVVNNSAGWLFTSQGRAADFARWGIFYAVTCVGAFVIGLPYGAVGVATAYAASECLRLPLLWKYVTRKGPIRACDVGRTLLPQTVSGGIAALVLLGCRHVMANTPTWLLLGGGIFASYATAGLVMLLFPGGRETIKQTVAFARHSFLQVTAKCQFKTSVFRNDLNQP